MIAVAMTTGEAHDTDNWRYGAPIYLALGSNLGDREANLREALERLAACGLTILQRSAIYETEPVGFADQDWFLNQVIEVWGLYRQAPGLSQREADVIG